MRKKNTKINLFCLIVALFLFLTFTSAAAQNKAQKIDEFVKLCYEYNIFSGTALVVEKGKIIYKKGIGHADRQWNIPNDTDTKFMLGSVSKQFTSMAVLRLVEKEKLKFDGKISDYLPFYPKDKGSKITIHNLLCHSSGLPDLPEVIKDFYSDVWIKPHTTEEYIKKFCDYELKFEPGSKFHYNSAGYFILASIIEEVTGKQFGEALKELVFDPLDMKDTGCYDYYSLLPKKASGYEYWNFSISNIGYTDLSIFKGTGSVYSTIEDLYKWDRALYTEKLLSKHNMFLLFKPHMQLGKSMSYAYGWVVGKRHIPEIEKSIYLTEHTGTFPGFYSVITRLPEDNSVVILLNNICDVKVIHMSRQIVNILYGEKYSIQKPFSLVLSECRTLKEIQKTLDDFKKSSSSYSIRRDAVNGLGFKFLLDGKEDMGMALLKFNAEKYPNTSDVYKSLAEAYIMTGEKELAVENFEKTLEKDPQNKYAKKKLAELLKK